jgi:DNA repair protein RecO
VNQLRTKAIVLSRTDYGEADRVVTLLTNDHGKITVMARGVRRIKSKLAGGIELFSIADIGFLPGKNGGMGTLISARLITYYDRIVHQIDRVQLGYELIRLLHRATEDQTEIEYFDLLQAALISLNDEGIAVELIQVWFRSQLLKLAGHTPNLITDEGGNKLESTNKYSFNFDTVGFHEDENGRFSSRHIKLLRLLFSGSNPTMLSHIEGLGELLPECAPLIQTMLQTYIRI